MADRLRERQRLGQVLTRVVIRAFDQVHLHQRQHRTLAPHRRGLQPQTLIDQHPGPLAVALGQHHGAEPIQHDCHDPGVLNLSSYPQCLLVERTRGRQVPRENLGPSQALQQDRFGRPVTTGTGDDQPLLPARPSGGVIASLLGLHPRIDQCDELNPRVAQLASEWQRFSIKMLGGGMIALHPCEHRGGQQTDGAPG